ncbi:TetR/AcrR family transcriptional regulator [Skermania sp. ID1734]|uniref:SACE_7040 family transcriptional regulator n=1 Tax=Skermania sp. ID1734 TaxID=2597516 RepID=UPI001180105D|nr:TetR/AcrR family transcriptional regulator [Skermania sp. ID1734]TSE02174.1 TetR/AcrR family transcriptional regulator [Skermania sp. ID1734]
MSIETETPTRREQMKANRRNQLVQAGARLIAERGFLGVRLEDLGAAAGISGPAVYRHFSNKEALLVELLVRISQRLLDGGTAVVEQSTDPAEALAGLIEFHLDFALGEPDLIRIQDRDLENLPTAAKRQVRKAQRQYVEIWVGVLRQLDPALGETQARVQAHATFGLINSTPHSASTLPPAVARPVLRQMAAAALSAPVS